jgi:hypothetical protein
VEEFRLACCLMVKVLRDYYFFAIASFHRRSNPSYHAIVLLSTEESSKSCLCHSLSFLRCSLRLLLRDPRLRGMNMWRLVEVLVCDLETPSNERTRADLE